MEPIRILHVIENFSLNNGVNSVVMNYYNHIDRSRFIFDFIVHEPVPEENIERFRKNGSRVYIMPQLRVKNLVAYIIKLARFFIIHKEYRIIHGHLPNAAFLYLGIARLFRIPVRIVHSHNEISADTFLKKVRNNILNLLIPLAANQYAACSRNSAKYLFGKRGESAFLLNNAIDTGKFSYSHDTRIRIRKELNISEEQLVIGHVGRFCPQKNHAFIIDVFFEVCSILPDSRLILIGDGELFTAIERKVNSLDLSNKVVLVGVSDRVNEYLQAMDIFILPSLFEGFPVSAVEAQMSGLVCYLSDNINPQVSFSDKTYFLNIKEPASAWAQKIIHCNNARERRTVYDPRFDIKVQAKRLEDYYLHLYHY
ncbi:MAG TPA: glycosyltransferase [Thermoclostridium sp.]